MKPLLPRTEKEMNWLLPRVGLIVFTCSIGLACAMWYIPGDSPFVTFFADIGLIFLFSPILLFILDRFEQRYPGLEPYFNPFDKKIQEA